MDADEDWTEGTTKVAKGGKGLTWIFKALCFRRYGLRPRDWWRGSGGCNMENTRGDSEVAESRMRENRIVFTGGN